MPNASPGLPQGKTTQRTGCNALLMIAIISYFAVHGHVHAHAQSASTEILTNESIVELHQSGLAEALIIRKIVASAATSKFDLTTGAIAALKRAGVLDSVIGAMMDVSLKGDPATVPATPPDAPPTVVSRPGLLRIDVLNMTNRAVFINELSRSGVPEEILVPFQREGRAVGVVLFPLQRYRFNTRAEQDASFVIRGTWQDTSRTGPLGRPGGQGGGGRTTLHFAASAGKAAITIRAVEEDGDIVVRVDGADIVRLSPQPDQFDQPLIPTNEVELPIARLRRTGVAFDAMRFVRSAEAGDLDAIGLFLAAGMDVNAVGERGTSALAAAARNGHIDVMQLLLNRGARVEQVDDFGETPLISAASAFWDQTEAIRLLIQAGADPNARRRNPRGRSGDIALHYAKSASVAQVLVDAGSDLNARDSEGNSPLMTLAAGSAEALPAIALLLDAGADAKTVNRLGEGVMSLATSFCASNECAAGAVEVIQLLAQNGAPVNLADREGRTPLMVAAGLPGRDYAVEAFLGRGDGS